MLQYVSPNLTRHVPATDDDSRTSLGHHPTSNINHGYHLRAIGCGEHHAEPSVLVGHALNLNPPQTALPINLQHLLFRTLPRSRRFHLHLDRPLWPAGPLLALPR